MLTGREHAYPLIAHMTTGSHNSLPKRRRADDRQFFELGTAPHRLSKQEHGGEQTTFMPSVFLDNRGI